MELRYKKNGMHWMPQRKDKTGAWIPFSEEWTQKRKEILQLSEVISSLTERSNAFYSNTKEMFFDNEMQVSAFLGGCQAYFRENIKEFGIFLEESEK